MDKVSTKIDELLKWVDQNCDPSELDVQEYQEFLIGAIDELQMRLRASRELDSGDL